MSSSKLLVRRGAAFVGKYARKYKVFVDDMELASLEADSFLTIELPSGTYDIQIKVGSNYSNILTVELFRDQTSQVNCGPRALPLALGLATSVSGLLVSVSYMFIFLSLASFIAWFKFNDPAIVIESPQAKD